jgi:hypothetical protein
MRDSVVRAGKQVFEFSSTLPEPEQLALAYLEGSVQVLEALGPYVLTDEAQERAGRLLFEWWWNVGKEGEGLISHWHDCTEQIQAFWMDGAWRAHHA